MRKRKQFTSGFKREAGRLMESSEKPSSAAFANWRAAQSAKRAANQPRQFGFPLAPGVASPTTNLDEWFGKKEKVLLFIFAIYQLKNS
jgi:hypothetical protein